MIATSPDLQPLSGRPPPCCPPSTPAPRSSAAALAQAGQRPARDRVGHAASPGTGLYRRSFLARSGGAAISSRGARAPASRVGFSELEAGDRQRPGLGGRPQRVLVSVFLDGGARLALDPRPGQRQQVPPSGDRRCGSSPTPRARSSARTTASALASEGRRSCTRCTRRGRSRSSRRSATTTPRPIALHLPSLLGGGRALDPRRPSTGWMGRFLDVIGTMDNPLQGLSLDGWPVAGAGDLQRSRGRGRLRPRVRPLDAGRLGRRHPAS